MIEFSTSLRVRYAETDRMGYVYYGNYAIYFEVARVETLRNIGVTYKELEDRGILLPVVDYSIRFLKPALYDDELRVRTRIPEMPGARITFSYETLRGDELLNTASTSLVFLDAASNRPMRCPEDISERLAPHY